LQEERAAVAERESHEIRERMVPAMFERDGYDVLYKRKEVHAAEAGRYERIYKAWKRVAQNDRANTRQRLNTLMPRVAIE